MNYRETGLPLEKPVKHCRHCQHVAHRWKECAECPVDRDCNRIRGWQLGVVIAALFVREFLLIGAPRPVYWLSWIAMMTAAVVLVIAGVRTLSRWWSESGAAMRALHEAQLEPPSPTPIRVDAANDNGAPTPSLAAVAETTGVSQEQGYVGTN